MRIEISGIPVGNFAPPHAYAMPKRDWFIERLGQRVSAVSEE